MRSRVIPGSSPPIDRRDPVRRLNSVLLPTFGRPQTAISGSSRASALPVSVTICEASSSTSRQSSSSIRSRPATFSDRGVCRPTIPSAGRVKFGRAVAAGFFGGAPGPIAFRFSLSGDCFVTREAFSAAARFVESTFRFRGSTAPVVGVARGARPFFGRVLACRCFFPNRFLLSLCAIVVPSLGTAAPLSIIGTRDESVSAIPCPNRNCQSEQDRHPYRMVILRAANDLLLTLASLLPCAPFKLL